MRKAEGKAGAGPQVDIPEAGGGALPRGVKKSMEKKLGADLSGVKVHTGGDSAGAANKLNARAFTVGSDVHFNAGEFNPGSKEGTKLLAHELTHVVQGQKGGVQKKEDEGEADAEGKDGEALEVSDPEEPAEKEADEVADKATDDMGDGGAEADGKEDAGEEASNDTAGPEAKKGDEESEEPADETEEKAPEAGAKLQSPISAKYSASALRKILRKTAFRDEEPTEEAAPEAEAAAPEGEDKQEESTDSENAEGEAPQTEGKKVAAKLRGIHRKIFRTTAAPVTAASVNDEASLKEFCRADPVATQKLSDVDAETNMDPRKKSNNKAKEDFYAAVINWVKANPTANPATVFNACFNRAATPLKFMGTPVPAGTVTQMCSRTCGLGGWYFKVANKAAFSNEVKNFLGPGLDQAGYDSLGFDLFKSKATAGADLLASVDPGAVIEPSGSTWFSPDSYNLTDCGDVGYAKLLKLAALQPEWFPDGTVAFEIAPDGFDQNQMKKPTAYDGMQSSLWVSRPTGEDFGVTGGGAQEFLAGNVRASSIRSARAVIPSAEMQAQIQAAINTAMQAQAAQNEQFRTALNDPTKQATFQAVKTNLTDMFMRGTLAPNALQTKIRETMATVLQATDNERIAPSAGRASTGAAVP